MLDAPLRLKFGRHLVVIKAGIVPARMGRRRGEVRPSFVHGPGFQLAQIAFFQADLFLRAVGCGKVHRIGLRRQAGRKVQDGRLFRQASPSRPSPVRTRAPGVRLPPFAVGGKVSMGLASLLFRVLAGGFGFSLSCLWLSAFFFSSAFSACSVSICAVSWPHLPLQFFNIHAVSFAARSGKIHRYGVAAVLELHRLEAVDGGCAAPESATCRRLTPGPA